MARKLPPQTVGMEERRAPGTCVDCGNDAFIRLSSSDGREDMICGRCYAKRGRASRVAVKSIEGIRTETKTHSG